MTVQIVLEQIGTPYIKTKYEGKIIIFFLVCKLQEAAHVSDIIDEQLLNNDD